MASKTIFTHDFGKFKMVLDRGDSDISRQIHNQGWYVDEKFDTEIFRKYLKSGMTLVDLGANVGFYTIFGRSIVGNKGRVFAFEPFPRNAELISASVKANAFANVTVVQSAVSNINGRTTLFLSPDASSEHSLLDLDFPHKRRRKIRRSIRIKSVRLDDYFMKNVSDTHVDFVKMDIEGSEFNALEGMQKILAENKKVIIMTEFWPNGFRKDGRDPYEFLENLVRNGFEIQFIDSLEQKFYSVSPGDMKKTETIRSKDESTQNEVMRVWGWYTNLICTRNWM